MRKLHWSGKDEQKRKNNWKARKYNILCFHYCLSFSCTNLLKELNVFSLQYDILDIQTLSHSIFWKQFLFHLWKLFASIVDTLHLESFRHLVFLLWHIFTLCLFQRKCFSYTINFGLIIKILTLFLRFTAESIQVLPLSLPLWSYIWTNW